MSISKSCSQKKRRIQIAVGACGGAVNGVGAGISVSVAKRVVIVVMVVVCNSGGWWCCGLRWMTIVSVHHEMNIIDDQMTVADNLCPR